MPTIIESIATASPPYCRSQSFAASFVMKIEGIPESIRSRIPQIHERSAIERRFSVIQDYILPVDEYDFFPRNAALSPAPSTSERGALYRKWAPILAEDAARKALTASGRSADEITHVIAISCTGFNAPGIDIHLVKSLGLRASTERTVIGFMGCYAAFPGLRTARAICESDPAARVLMVCVELCTLHFQVSGTLESAVVNALFSDGAAAVILSGQPSPKSSPSQSAPPAAPRDEELPARDGDARRMRIVDTYSVLDENSADDMTWEIGDTGFLMGLSPRVPGVIAGLLPTYVDTLLERNGLTRKDIDFWAAHPGGRQVLDKTVSALNLSTDDLADSYGVLRDYGNMSSPTILFILKRLMDRDAALPSDSGTSPRRGIAMAFGPGLAIEGCLIEFG